jgi:hypothetical protein
MVRVCLRVCVHTCVALRACVCAPLSSCDCQISSSKYDALVAESYRRAGSVAAGALSSVRTVMAFGRQGTELRKYAAHLDRTEAPAKKKSVLFGLGMVRRARACGCGPA